MLFRCAVASVLSLAVAGGAESAVTVLRHTGTMPGHELVALAVQPPPQPAPPQTAPPPPPPGPFSNLFRPKVSPRATPAAGKPRVACGITVVPVSPSFDASIRKPPPTRPKPSARIVPTPRCR